MDATPDLVGFRNSSDTAALQIRSLEWRVGAEVFLIDSDANFDGWSRHDCLTGLICLGNVQGGNEHSLLIPIIFQDSAGNNLILLNALVLSDEMANT